MSSAIIVESHEHFIFGMLGGAGTGIWIVITSFFPPCASTKPWMNNVLRVIAILSAVGGVTGATSFSSDGRELGAVGEYISVGGFCIYLAAVAVKIHSYEVTVQDNPNNFNDYPDIVENLQKRPEEQIPFQV